MKTKTRRRLQWALINSSLPILIWMGVHGSPIAVALASLENVALFLLSLFISTLTICAHAIRDVKLDALMVRMWKGPSVPVWLDLLYDLSVMWTMALVGWFWMASLYLFHTICLQVCLSIMRHIIRRHQSRCIVLN